MKLSEFIETLQAMSKESGPGAEVYLQPSVDAVRPLNIIEPGYLDGQARSSPQWQNLHGEAVVLIRTTAWFPAPRPFETLKGESLASVATGKNHILLITLRERVRFRIRFEADMDEEENIDILTSQLGAEGGILGEPILEAYTKSNRCGLITRRGGITWAWPDHVTAHFERI